MIINGEVFNGDSLLQDHAVVIEDGVIRDVIVQSEMPSAGIELFDNRGNTLLPGFIDLQVNGGGGVLFSDVPTVDTIRTIGAAHRSFGTTGFLPTVITDDLTVMRQAIEAVEKAIAEGVQGVLGIHLEGPFLNPDKRGIHDITKIRAIDEQGVRIISSSMVGKTLVTIAPELADPEIIRSLVKKGVIVCAGHSAASYAQALEGLAAGISGFTHLFNAMTPLQSREPGLVGAALEDEDSWFGIIADGHHVHPATFQIAIAAKKRGGAILVTDAMPSVGSDSSTFMLGGEIISVADGRCTNNKGVLAGSDLNMITAINNAANFARLDWLEAVRMATQYPARALGMDDKLGYVKPGYAASLVAVDPQRKVVDLWIDGDHTRIA